MQLLIFAMTVPQVKPKDKLFRGEEWQSECERLRSFILACLDLFMK